MSWGPGTTSSVPPCIRLPRPRPCDGPDYVHNLCRDTGISNEISPLRELPRPRPCENPTRDTDTLPLLSPIKAGSLRRPDAESCAKFVVCAYIGGTIEILLFANGPTDAGQCGPSGTRCTTYVASDIRCSGMPDATCVGCRMARSQGGPPDTRVCAAGAKLSNEIP